MNGQRTIVTGGTRGLGWWTALGLARANADVVVTARSQPSGQAAVDKIRRLEPNAKVRVELLDLSSLASVRRFAERMLRGPAIDLLVNCAGAVIPSREITEDGLERTLATDYLGPFALTLGLLPALLRAPRPRVTTVTSLGADKGKRAIDFADLQGARAYSPQLAYNQAKLADLMFALELGHRASQAGLPLISNAAHPGLARTDLQWGVKGRRPSAGIRILMRLFGQRPEVAVRSILRAATDPAAISGSYYGPERGLKGEPVPCAVYSAALDPEARTRLWSVSEELTGMRWQL